MTEFSTREWILVKRPSGLLASDDVAFRQATITEPEPGMLVIKNRFISLDPAIRDWMSESKSYLPPIPLGTPVWASVVGEVVASNSSKFKVGDKAWGMGSWAEYSLCPEDYVFAVDESLGLPLNNHLSVVGAVGMTAYYGLLKIGQPRSGETVLVSTAAGAVGSLVAQIARIKGCRVVGLAGSEEKCRWLTEDLGLDSCINYKQSDDLEAAIAAHCPDGVDVYFDNVGGDMLDAALMNINKHARIVFCGRISGLNAENDRVPGPWNMWQILAQCARLEGFLISEYFSDFHNSVPEMAEWVKSGEIQFREDIVDGLENTPQAYLKLFDGSNKGKLMVRV
jgi:NADPH-dependent curcumin reductase CurA